MDDVLVRIKRLVLGGRYAFSQKAEDELVSDDLTHEDVVEAIVNAAAIYKVLRSRSPRRSRRAERLYVIVGTTYDGLPIYTKGTIRKVRGQDVFYFLVSSKRWTQAAD